MSDERFLSVLNEAKDLFLEKLQGVNYSQKIIRNIRNIRPGNHSTCQYLGA